MSAKKRLATLKSALQQGNKRELAECFKQLLIHTQHAQASKLLLEAAKKKGADTKIWDVIRLTGKDFNYKLPTKLGLELLKHNQEDEKLRAWLKSHINDFDGGSMRGNLSNWCTESGMKPVARLTARKLLAHELEDMPLAISEMQLKLIPIAPEWVDVSSLSKQQLVSSFLATINGNRQLKDSRLTECEKIHEVIWEKIQREKKLSLPVDFVSSVHMKGKSLLHYHFKDKPIIAKLKTLWERSIHEANDREKSELFRKWARNCDRNCQGGLLTSTGFLPLEPLLENWKPSENDWENVTRSTYTLPISREVMKLGFCPPLSLVQEAVTKDEWNNKPKDKKERLDFALDYYNFGGDLEALLPSFDEELQPAVKSILLKGKTKMEPKRKELEMDAEVELA